MGNKPASPVIAHEAAASKLSKETKQMCLQAFGTLHEISAMTSTAGKGAVGGISEYIFHSQVAIQWDNMNSYVISRLFKALDADANGYLDQEEFITAVYLLGFSSKIEKLKLVFYMFDISGNGSIAKKDFRNMAFAVINGVMQSNTLETRQQNALKMNRSTPKGNVQFGEGLLDRFGPLADMMTETVMLQFDADGDGKLNWQEWYQFAQQEEHIQKLADTFTADPLLSYKK